MCTERWKKVSNTAQWLASPACTELEQVVMDWGAKLFGLGDQFLCKSKVGGGVIQVGVSALLAL